MRRRGRPPRRRGSAMLTRPRHCAARPPWSHKRVAPMSSGHWDESWAPIALDSCANAKSSLLAARRWQ
eukprot:3016162-Pyramimonas_sp.AAC.1